MGKKKNNILIAGCGMLENTAGAGCGNMVFDEGIDPADEGVRLEGRGFSESVKKKEF
jgi:hypothetical protein